MFVFTKSRKRIKVISNRMRRVCDFVYVNKKNNIRTLSCILLPGKKAPLTIHVSFKTSHHTLWSFNYSNYSQNTRIHLDLDNSIVIQHIAPMCMTSLAKNTSWHKIQNKIGKSYVKLTRICSICITLRAFRPLLLQLICR
jgi:hypothetical protein